VSAYDSHGVSPSAASTSTPTSATSSGPTSTPIAANQAASRSRLSGASALRNGRRIVPTIVQTTACVRPRISAWSTDAASRTTSCSASAMRITGAARHPTTSTRPSERPTGRNHGETSSTVVNVLLSSAARPYPTTNTTAQIGERCRRCQAVSRASWPSHGIGTARGLEGRRPAPVSAGAFELTWSPYANAAAVWGDGRDPPRRVTQWTTATSPHLGTRRSLAQRLPGGMGFGPLKRTASRMRAMAVRRA
jgi:hypothetical protein